MEGIEFSRMFLYQNKIDIFEVFIKSYISLKGVKDVNEQSIKIFAYLCTYGISNETYEKLLMNKVVKTKQSYFNCISLLKKANFISKKRNVGLELNEPFKDLNFEEYLDIRVRCKLIN